MISLSFDKIYGIVNVYMHISLLTVYEKHICWLFWSNMVILPISNLSVLVNTYLSSLYNSLETRFCKQLRCFSFFLVVNKGFWEEQQGRQYPS